MGRDERRAKRSVRDNVKNRAEKKSSDGWVSTSLTIPEGVSFFSVKKPGVRRIDILPYEVKQDGNPFAAKGSLHYERTYWAHRGIGPNNDSYICAAKTFNKKCPICEYRAKLQKDPDADEQMVKDLAPKERQLFNVIDTAERDKGIQIWDVSFFLFGKALDAAIRNADDDEDYAGFADLNGGLTLKLGFEEKSFNGGSFCAVESITFKQREEDYSEDMLDKVVDLDAALKLVPFDELKKILLQTDDEDDDKKEETAPPPKKSQINDDEDKDEDAPPPKPKPKAEKKEEADGDKDEDAPPPKTEKKEAKEKSKAECPHKHKFGKDCDKYEECDDCPSWDACDSANAAS